MTDPRIFLSLLLLLAMLCPGCGQAPADTTDSIIESTFDDIKFEMEKAEEFQRSMLTPKIEELLGRRIRIRGYMYPTLKKNGLKRFVLVRDNLECCFGPGAALFDCIAVKMLPDKTAVYSLLPVTVEGTFKFEERRDYDESLLAIYNLDAEVVK